MASTGSVDIVVSIISATVDWLSLNLDWDVLTVGIDTVVSITSIVPLALDIPHERGTIGEAVVIAVTGGGILCHDNGIFELLSALEPTRKVAGD